MADDKPKDTTGDALWFLFKVFLAVFLFWLVTGGPERAKNDSLFRDRSDTATSSISSWRDNRGGSTTTRRSRTTNDTTNNETSGEVLNSNTSSYQGKVKIRLEKGRSVYQPDQEYISLYSVTSNKEPINITGWKLKNGKDEKLYDRSGQLVRYSADTVSIPQGVNLFLAGGPYSLGSISLEPGAKAYVITGRMPNVIPYPIPYSFRINKCSGYLEDLPNYTFTPSLSLSCPRAETEARDVFVDNSCTDFLKRIKACHMPEIKQDGSVDGKFGIGVSCQNFIKTRLNYNACVSHHLADQDFFKKDWMVYLNYKGELWPKTGSITLYDQSGKVVDKLEY